ncbi:hypothetical protein BsWGS_26522 [Bradybaena similaris]
MTANTMSSCQIGTAALKSDGNVDTLGCRLSSAEEDARRLIQQLEEIGFSAKLNSEAISRDLVGNTSGKNLYSKNQEIDALICGTDQHLLHAQEQMKESDRHLQQNLSNTFNIQNNNSSKQRPVTSLSFHDLTSSSLICGRETKPINYSMKKLASFENVSKKQMRSGHMDRKTGQSELEQELVKTRHQLSQLEEELQDEKEDKEKAQEEAEKLRILLDDVTSAQAGLEMKVEELMSGKQKLTRRMSELKDEADRESSLRCSLEESHATLLSRLQDMEAVVDSLRAECKTHVTNSSNMKAELAQSKDELRREIMKRQQLEDSYIVLTSEKDKLLLNANSSQHENQRVLQELTSLQTQYADLIKELQQMQTLTDNLSAGKKEVEEQCTSLENRVQTLATDHDRLRTMYEELKQSQSKLAAEKSVLDEDFVRQMTEKDKLIKENSEKKQQIDSLQQELQAMKQGLAQKNLEFASAADSLELELTGFKKQLDTMERDKSRVLKDKENLLEEVNQTVDTLMSERSRLQTELQASCVETESLRLTCSRLELDKSQLLEKLESLQQQQATQRTVEAALKEMMEQKTKLAYENGKLQALVDQLQQELAMVTKDHMSTFQLRKLTESLQVKYAKSQQEISEYKITLQKLEGQSRMAVEDLQQKDHELKMAQVRRDEAEREKEQLLAQIEVLEGRQLYKVSRYEKNMEDAKSINKEITGTLEDVMTSHNQLQNIVVGLQVELGKRDNLISQLKTSRNKQQEEMKNEIQNYEDKMEQIREELKKEREKNGKKTAREISEVCKQNENLSSRNQDLVKANSELRQKMAEVEKEKNEMKRKMLGQRHKLQYLHKTKKQLEENFNKMKAVREDIEELDKMRDEYMQKNKEQGDTIGKFIHQVASLQDEVKQLVTAHSKTQLLLRLKDEALEKERRILDDMRGKYMKSKKREEELCQKSKSSEEKLQEAHSESLEISRHLEEAHDWFKGKFDKLQCDLTASRQIQAKLETNNVIQRQSLEVEKSRAQQAAGRAKEMVQMSRQTINQLADYAKLADIEIRQPSPLQ